MKKDSDTISIFYKIENLIKRKNIWAFLVSLILATVFWFLNALNKDLTTTTKIPVNYINAPDGQYLQNIPATEFEIKITGRGFVLLKYKLGLEQDTIALDISHLIRNLVASNGKFYISSDALISEIEPSLDEEIKIDEIKPYYIAMALDFLNKKRVPVTTDIEINYAPSFNISGNMELTPGIVTVNGVNTSIDTIKSIKTKFKKLEKVDSDIETELYLIAPAGITLSENKILVKIPVEKFTEKELKIQIGYINVPENVKLKLFPSEITVSFTVGLSAYNSIEPDSFTLVVDYNSIKGQKSNLEIQVIKKPEFIQNLKIHPETVEYLIESQ